MCTRNKIQYAYKLTTDNIISQIWAKYSQPPEYLVLQLLGYWWGSSGPTLTHVDLIGGFDKACTMQVHIVDNHKLNKIPRVTYNMGNMLTDLDSQAYEDIDMSRE